MKRVEQILGYQKQNGLVAKREYEWKEKIFPFHLNLYFLKRYLYLFLLPTILNLSNQRCNRVGGNKL